MPIVPDASWRPVIQDTVTIFMDFVENRDAAQSQLTINIQEPVDSFAQSHEGERDERLFALWDNLKVDRSASILEVGAGNLRTTKLLVERGYNIVAVEPVPEVLRSLTTPLDQQIPRICCSGSRLPFATASFDFCFCQATLHHLDDMRPVVREMLRVVRPGGGVLLASEPFSAVGSNLRRLREAFHDVSFELGSNEMLPRFHEYWNALKRAGAEGIVAHSRTEDMRPAEKARRLHIPLPYQGSMHQTTSGLPALLRHGLSHGEVSLHARRGPHAPENPPVMSDFPFPATQYTTARCRASLVGAWKSLLSPKEVPVEIICGKNDMEHLRRGFIRADLPHHGLRWRWLQTQGAALMSASGASREASLRVTASGPPSTCGEWELTAFADQVELGSRLLQPDDEWQELKWAVPPGMPPILEIRLRSSRVELREAGAVSVRLASLKLA